MTGFTVAEHARPVPALRAGGPMFVGAARIVPSGFASGAWTGLTDVLWLLAMVFALPFVILAIGVPIALTLQTLLWLGRLL